MVKSAKGIAKKKIYFHVLWNSESCRCKVKHILKNTNRKTNAWFSLLPKIYEVSVLLPKTIPYFLSFTLYYFVKSQETKEIWPKGVVGTVDLYYILNLQLQGSFVLLSSAADSPSDSVALLSISACVFNSSIQHNIRFLMLFWTHARLGRLSSHVLKLI